MIDLRAAKLPDTINVDGAECPVYTDYRCWIEFERGIRHDGVYSTVIFVDSAPEGDSWVAPAVEFLRNPNSTPRGRGSNVRAIDLIEDGEFVVASFQQAYGIDLTSGEYMHWHRFKALLEGLPDDTKMAKVIGYRTWTKQTKKPDAAMAELRNAWRLPEITHDDAEAKAIAEQLYELQMGVNDG